MQFSLFFLLLLPLASLITAQRFCPRGSFRPGNGTCPLCPRGTHQPSANKPSCISCPLGTFQPREGTAFPETFDFTSPRSCISCPIGTFSASKGAGRCRKCPTGMTSGTGYARCYKCGPGTHLFPFKTSQFQRNECRSCESGTFSDGPANLFCSECPPGSVSNEGATKCTKCPPGTLHFKKECLPCAPGTFNEKSGMDVCELCPVGMISAEGASNCSSCDAGSFSFRVGSATCEKCPSGTSSKGMNPAGCKDKEKGCPVNTFEGASGECHACVPGERLDTTLKRCISCAVDEISTGGASAKCVKCPDGEIPSLGYGLRDGAVCVCKLGLSRPYDGASCVRVDKSCPTCSGKITKFNRRARNGLKSFSPRGVEAQVVECSRGLVANRNRTKCVPCRRGFFVDNGVCRKCPDGYSSGVEYDFDGIRTSPKSCTSESTGCTQFEKKRSGTCVMDSCPRMTRFLRRRRTCVGCDSGYFLNLSWRCFPCPPNKVSSGGASLQCMDCPTGFVGRVSGRGDRCVCENGTGEKDGSCVQCRPGTFRRAKNSNLRCAACPVRTVSVLRGSTACVNCPFGFVTNVLKGATECVPCPPLTFEGKNLFGDGNNKCEPEDPYRNSPSFLNSLPGAGLI